ncbi:MAG: NADPH-dependent F420 reductase [Hyphomicrobiales bacterium]
MKIGILGSGNVGRALGLGLAALGHDVKIGTRNPKAEALREWAAAAGPKASVGSPADAAAHGEIVFLATAWSGAEHAIGLAGPGNFATKIVVDVTNPLRFEPGKPPALAVSGDDSGGEQVQRWLPESRVVKAFNIVGSAHMFRPDFPGGPPDMFLGGDDAGAKREVTEILTSFGWNVTDLGGIETARYLESLAMVWILHAVRTKSTGHAFKLLRK